jgi:hypothetical protein
MIHHRAIPELQLGPELQQLLENLDWKKLTVTTEANRVQVLKRMLRSGSNWSDYLTFYGWLLGKIGVVKNLRLDADLEQAITKVIQDHFGCAEAPVLRLQVMFGGEMLPLHTDMTRHASLIFPVANHNSARTNFYRSMTDFDPALPNPVYCSCVETTVITVPTLIDTDCIHSVVYIEPITEQRPRISLTAKWANTKFRDLV